MADKPFHEMTDDELRGALADWEKHVETATGWASAYFAASQIRAIVSIGNVRGIGMTNRFPIRIG